MYRPELMKVCNHVTRSCTCTDSCLFSHILLLALILHVYYTPIPTTLFISTDNLLVLLEDAHESQTSTKAVAKTQVVSLTPDKEQSSPVQTGADKGSYGTFSKKLDVLRVAYG